MAPRLDSISNHRLPYGGEIQRVFLYGEGFKDVTSVMIGDTMVEQLWVDSETIMTIQLPHLVAGATYWVQINTLDGSSPCLNDGQMLTVDAMEDVPHAPEVSLTSITPEEITLGRSAQYWLLGSGLSQVTLAVINGSTPGRIESYDDERLILTVPEEIDGASDGGELTIEVSGPNCKPAQLKVVGRSGQPEPTDPNEHLWPGVTSVSPEELPAAGGELTLYGYRLTNVTTVTVGQVACAVTGSADEWLTAQVPDMSDYISARLPVAVATADWGSPLLDNPPTVLIGN